ncbi:MAG: sel1 repeat family protein [Gammaproteobacteria bacterium]|nr:sel1 repeat family protein [Gammaproteobacteria bacterium]MBU1490437.1 sel1 repeat family protein [Gammaproteobacteria bacterium]MBU2140320.1 sel1 repeat family protein [Gammaproteobacteria bacterium]MBU2217125.1 sel1 repeat family protein [Gammaproteobacteria bacterium]MBU2323504.1 sel1 repeat family protein [Gammaproteobacteria bacterium]
MLHALRARLSYWLARRLFHWSWWVKQPRGWRWLEGQFARMAALGDRDAQSFYGHILLFRGQGLGARQEGLRLLRLAGEAGDGKAAYQLGVQSLKGDVLGAADGQQAAYWWQLALRAGHPLAAARLASLYQDGAPGLDPDAAKSKAFAAQAATFS